MVTNIFALRKMIFGTEDMVTIHWLTSYSISFKFLIMLQ